VQLACLSKLVPTKPLDQASKAQLVGARQRGRQLRLGPFLRYRDPEMTCNFKESRSRRYGIEQRSDAWLYFLHLPGPPKPARRAGERWLSLAK